MIRNKQYGNPGLQWDNTRELLQDEAFGLESIWSFLCWNPTAKSDDVMKEALALSFHLIYG
jgi:hypothetical protein